MFTTNNPGGTPSDDFLDQILGFPSYAAGADPNYVGNEAEMMLQLGLGHGSAHLGRVGIAGAYGVGSGFPLWLSLEQGKGGFNDASGSGKTFHRAEFVDFRASSNEAGFHGQPVVNTVQTAPCPPAIRPRIRARRGQATDPHSIAERFRREKIAERIRALQELVPGANKTDRAAMIDEIMEYVKFLRLQVKVLSMCGLGGAGAVAPLVTDIPISSVEEECGDGGRAQPAWEKWLNDGTESVVAKLMEENTGAAMQFLESKGLCIMPISVASAICHIQPPETTSVLAKPESDILKT